MSFEMFLPTASGSTGPDAPGSDATGALICAELSVILDGDDGLLGPAQRAHVAHCLRCQAAMANHRRLRRSLRALAVASVPMDPTLEQEILLTLDRHDARHPRRVPGYAAATLGGLAAAAGVIALATRQRRGTRLAG